MKVFVTGADGFIGSHLTEKLVKEGHKVKALSQYNSFGFNGWLETIPKEILNEIEIVNGDIRDCHFIRNVSKDQDTIFHLAALIAIPFSYVAPNSYIETNITGTLNVLEAAKLHNISQVIHTSTSEVYGTADYVPINEAHPLKGQSPYSASKIGADQIAYSYYSSFEAPVSIIRPFNTYGPRQSARAVIPTIISQIAAGKETIKLGSLTPTRDFNFVEDTVNGFLSALGKEQSFGEVINIGSGFEISIKDLVEAIAESMGKKVTVEEDQQRLRPKKSEVERLLACNKKAKEILDWSPKYAGRDGLIQGLGITADWFQQPENLQRYKTDKYNI